MRRLFALPTSKHAQIALTPIAEQNKNILCGTTTAFVDSVFRFFTFRKLGLLENWAPTPKA
jgi:hypothetical protein